ncbi:hypothetical protein LKL35_00135 [Streptomyces sp. ET3-23]|uniref:hypothetical protein n=1 Tax=Streptomyces sp. ET3-23 TaxID=2885643 RepID=UPI001D11646F|nr:hypothetical protein [Streptomyces sp. ET3-23]MCC2273861.1 hypothetical protein [Streptomyces sp. ET3-23]
MDLRDPGGSNTPINNLTVQYLGILDRYSTAVIWAGGNSTWEQALVVYVNGIRQAEQIGNYDRPNSFSLGERAFAQEIALAGWHKESPPDGGQPWIASRGQLIQDGAHWDDTGTGEGFGSLTANIQVLSGTLHPIGH